MECRVAATETEKTAILEQRYAIYIEEYGFFPKREDNIRIETDRYDEYSLFFGVWEGAELIASCRLILPNTPFGLPTKTSMTITDISFDDSFTAEISRIMVSASNRSFRKTRRILQSMQEAIQKFSSEHGITLWIGCIEPSFLHLLNHSNLPYHPIGPLQYNNKADRYPVALDAKEYLDSLRGQR